MKLLYGLFVWPFVALGKASIFAVKLTFAVVLVLTAAIAAAISG